MKLAVAALLAIALVLAWLLNAEVATNNQQRSQIAELTSKLGDKTARENLEFQQKCAQQAEKIFHQLGYKLNEPRSAISASYESHYNTKLNKCFMTVSTVNMSTPRLTTSKFLLDAYEQRGYAEYMWMADKVKKFWEVPPVDCRLTPTSTDERVCKSEEEYKAFVATYME